MAKIVNVIAEIRARRDAVRLRMKDVEDQLANYLRSGPSSRGEDDIRVAVDRATIALGAAVITLQKISRE